MSKAFSLSEQGKGARRGWGGINLAFVMNERKIMSAGRSGQMTALIFKA